jgi:hypothetical protein
MSRGEVAVPVVAFLIPLSTVASGLFWTALRRGVLAIPVTHTSWARLQASDEFIKLCGNAPSVGASAKPKKIKVKAK